MSAPVRLVPAAVAPPRSLVAELTRLDAAGAPAWLGAKTGQVRPFATREAPAPEAPTPAPAPAVAPDPAVIEAARAAAHAEGERAGIAAGQAKVDAIIERYADALTRLGKAHEERARAEASSAVELAMVVAKEIIGHELRDDREFLVTALTEALAMAGTDGPTRVRLGPTDLAYLEATRPDVLTGGVQIVEDDSLGIGGCVVESEHLVVDATVEGRLAAIAQAVRGVLDAAPEGSR